MFKHRCAKHCRITLKCETYCAELLVPDISESFKRNLPLNWTTSSVSKRRGSVSLTSITVSGPAPPQKKQLLKYTLVNFLLKC